MFSAYHFCPCALLSHRTKRDEDTGRTRDMETQRERDPEAEEDREEHRRYDRQKRRGKSKNGEGEAG